MPSVNLFFIIFDPTLQRFEKASLAFARVLPENRSPSWFSWFSSVRGEFPEAPWIYPMLFIHGFFLHPITFLSLRQIGAGFHTEFTEIAEEKQNWSKLPPVRTGGNLAASAVSVLSVRDSSAKTSNILGWNQIVQRGRRFSRKALIPSSASFDRRAFI